MSSRGEGNCKAKLTEDLVREICRRHLEDGEPLVLLAWAFGVTATTIGGIVTGKTWRHVDAPRRAARWHRIAGHGPRYCELDGCELQHHVDGQGRLVVSCDGCDRRRARRCMDCGGPVLGRRWRCERHRLAAWRRSIRAFTERNRAEINARQRAALRQLDPETHRRRNEQKREWRRQNPRKVLEQKRRARLAGKPGGWATREKYLAYHARYRAEHRAELRRKMRARYRRTHPRQRPRCLVCGAPVPWRRGHGRPRTLCPPHHAVAYGPRPQPESPFTRGRAA